MYSDPFYRDQLSQEESIRFNSQFTEKIKIRRGFRDQIKVNITQNIYFRGFRGFQRLERKGKGLVVRLFFVFFKAYELFSVYLT